MDADRGASATSGDTTASGSREDGVVIPVGRQTISVPAAVGALLRSSDAALATLDATRVWVGRSDGHLVVRLGDVEPAPLDR
jgi:hypothetical protein